MSAWEGFWIGWTAGSVVLWTYFRWFSGLHRSRTEFAAARAWGHEWATWRCFRVREALQGRDALDEDLARGEEGDRAEL